MKNKKLLTLLLVILLLFISSMVYVNDYYHASPDVLSALVSDDQINVHTLDDDTLVFEPHEIKAGLIFYPGGKVEYTAYAPLLRQCAENGILTILVKMPLNLAVLDVNAADGLQEQYPQIENWYIGGHSLGGSMAASYLAKYPDAYQGLVLLAAYSTSDLSETNLNVISIYGSNDQVLNSKKYEDNKSNLPDNFTEYVIPGGSHAYFGCYGLQEGDGLATITNKEQIELTTVFLKEHLY